MSDTQREAFEVWQRDPRFYQWNTTDEHAELNFEAGFQAAQAADAGREAVADDTIDAVSIALRQAWQLGQTYWRQADHEFYSENRKSDETQRKFDALVDQTRTMLAAPASINAELVEALEAITDQLERIGDTRPHKDGQYIEQARAALARAKEKK